MQGAILHRVYLPFLLHGASNQNNQFLVTVRPLIIHACIRKEYPVCCSRQCLRLLVRVTSLRRKPYRQLTHSTVFTLI